MATFFLLYKSISDRIKKSLKIWTKRKFNRRKKNSLNNWELVSKKVRILSSWNRFQVKVEHVNRRIYTNKQTDGNFSQNVVAELVYSYAWRKKNKKSYQSKVKGKSQKFARNPNRVAELHASYTLFSFNF